MDDLTQRIQSLSANQQELLRRRLSQAQNPSQTPSAVEEGEDNSRRPLDFDLYFFSGDGVSARSDKYQLLLECATFADRHGFTAIWTPERHFQAFGGLYPNPAVLGAALATMTRHIHIRAGSVVLPLHSTIRIAEEWAVVDNLSQGRAGLSAATGWHPGDFVIAPQNFEHRRTLMFQELATLRRLWRGEAIEYPDGVGQMVATSILPRPIQPELPVWITSSGNPITWEMAGEYGTGVFASLIGETIESLSKKIQGYQAKLHQYHPSRASHVVIMLHTFVGDDDEQVRELVRPSLKEYLRTFVAQDTDIANATADFETLVDFAFERYFAQTALLGSPAKCQRLLDKLAAVGVNEIACLVDFGLDSSMILEGLQRLDLLRQQYVVPETGDIHAE